MPLTKSPFHLFLSYARADNEAPVNAAGQGWVTAFEEEIRQRHATYSGRQLRPFFDKDAIDAGTDWKRRLGEGIRQSRLFLAFLSPNYLVSPNCLWEWEEYLRREHSAARGDDGLTPIYFIKPSDLRLRDEQRLADWLAAMKQRYPRFAASRALDADAENRIRPFCRDLHRRNRSPDMELQDWFERGPQVLRELDAAERSEQVRTEPRDPAGDKRTLAERLDGLDRHIARRLDRIQLADLAPGNIARGHEHFVGRHRELSQLHDIMITGGVQAGGKGMRGRGIIAAAFAPGGLGKTALARQYAHAYAEFYAAGGIWEIACEGIGELGAALLKLADAPAFRRVGENGFDVTTQQPLRIVEPLVLGEDERASYPRAAAAVVDYLRRVTEARVAVLRDALRALPERHCPDSDPLELRQPRALLILDNVDKPDLLGATQRALLPADDWLEIVVTTRLDPMQFDSGGEAFAHVDVGVLPDADALQLLADFQPGRQFANGDEEAAARTIAQELGGYTLAVELVAAYLGSRARDGYQPSQYLLQLRAEGLVIAVDGLADDDRVRGEIRHSDDATKNRVGTLVRWSLDRLSAPARTALEFASLLMPDEMPLEWLEELTRACHSIELTTTAQQPSRWLAVWNELRGLRLLHPAGDVERDSRGIEKAPQLVRIHRLVAEHVRAPGLASRFTTIDRFFDERTTQFEQQVGQANDAALTLQHPWLRDQLDYLLTTQSATATILTSAGVAASYEGEHGSLSRALTLAERILSAKEELLAANPNSPQASRDVSVSLSQLGDFLSRRGQPGDAEQALAYYRRSLEVGEQLLAANPGSAQASRDVSVSLGNLGAFLSLRGQPGDAEQALSYYQRSLDVGEQLLAANPNSAQTSRDVSVSLSRLGDFLSRRGQPGDAEQALAYYRRSLEVGEQLLAANPGSAQASRDVLVWLERVAIAESGQGDEQGALAAQKRSLAIALELREKNPASWHVQRTAAVAFFQTSQRAQAAGDETLAIKCLYGCYQVLDASIEAGMDVDPAVRGLHAQLLLQFKQE